jgi:hypothetical protein
MTKPWEIDQGIVRDVKRDLYIISGSEVRLGNIKINAPKVFRIIQDVDLEQLFNNNGEPAANIPMKHLIIDVVTSLQKFNNSQSVESKIAMILAALEK